MRYCFSMSDEQTPLSFDFDLVKSAFDSRIMTYLETLDNLASPDVSMARFGDSEIKMLSESFSIGFQQFDPKLQVRLLDVAENPVDGLLVGFPPAFENEQWASMWSRLFEKTVPKFKGHDRFANTAVSRPPCFNELGAEAVELWQKVWDKRSVTVITGRGSRFDCRSELFDNASSVKLLSTEPMNAFTNLDEIKDQISRNGKDDIYLISLGPAATVLAYDLHIDGYKALDVGHLTASYDYKFSGGLYPEKLKMVRPE